MNFTQLPNTLIDDAKLNPYQFMIMAFIVRKTDGWCKTEDGISLSQFVEVLGISKSTVVRSLKELQQRDLIVIKNQFKDNGGKSYNLYSVSPTLVSVVNKGSVCETQGVVSERHIQKKANTKETNTSNKNLVKKETSLSEQDFEIFWKNYPRKISKVKAKKAWLSKNPDLEKVMYSLNMQKASSQWIKDNGKFIPHPTTWINGERWNDEVKLSDYEKVNAIAQHRGVEPKQVMNTLVTVHKDDAISQARLEWGVA